MKEYVEEYYKLIDKEDLTSMFLLFSKDIIYKRCEETMNGIEELQTFYNEKRIIKGKHKITSIIAEENKVAVEGIFIFETGKELPFSDFFEFNENNKISTRNTYIGEGIKKIT